MSETRSVNNGAHKVGTKRKSKKIRRLRFSLIIAVLIAVLAIGHIAWCLVNHINAEHICSVCGNAESGCTCSVTITDYATRIEELEAKVAELELDDGTCHRRCSIHCPPCEHTEKYTNYGEWVFDKSIGNEDECCQEKRIVVTFCSGCGNELSRTIEYRTVTQHTFNEEGTCEVCGYKKSTAAEVPASTTKPTEVPTIPDEPTKPTASPCQHSNTTTKTSDWVWSKVGTEGTCRTGTRTVTVVCKDCGVTISTKAESTTDNSHTFDGRTCTKCGYKKSCQHPSTTTDTSDWSWSKVGTEGTCRTGTRTITVVCKDCGITISTKTESTTDSSHTFDGRTCTKCGYKKPCEHSNTTTETSDWVWSKVGAEGTCMSGTRKVTVVCKDCGVTISTKTESTTDSSHTFDGRTCTKCGYKKPLAEGYGEASGTVEPPKNEVVIDDDGEEPSPVNP